MTSDCKLWADFENLNPSIELFSRCLWPITWSSYFWSHVCQLDQSNSDSLSGFGTGQLLILACLHTQHWSPLFLSQALSLTSFCFWIRDYRTWRTLSALKIPLDDHVLHAQRMLRISNLWYLIDQSKSSLAEPYPHWFLALLSPLGDSRCLKNPAMPFDASCQGGHPLQVASTASDHPLLQPINLYATKQFFDQWLKVSPSLACVSSAFSGSNSEAVARSRSICECCSELCFGND